ncbi:MAG: hypothetical protein K2N61_13995 [Lachnospiraceae bacterium]|nr:hypothetical protein [Lachnospiraceae bacterium]
MSKISDLKELEKSVQRKKAVLFGRRKDNSFFELPVQYNPATISLSNTTDSENEADAFQVTENLSLNSRSTLSFDLIFEALEENTDKDYVRIQAERILALTLDTDLSSIVFLYGEMSFQGELVQADIKYTMFDEDGNPLWATVSVEMIEKEEDSDDLENAQTKPPSTGISAKNVFSYQYQSLKKEYEDFETPVVVIKINQKDISDNKSGLSVADVEVDLSSGYEASMAVFSIYNCFDKRTASFRTEDLKKYIYLGSSVSVSMGYSEIAKIIFRGFIAKINFICEKGEMPYVQVTSLDIKGIMMSGCYAKQMKASCYSEAVREVFEKTVYTRMQNQDIFTDLSIARTPDCEETQGENSESDRTIEMVNESDYEFIVRAAKKFNFEFYVESGKVIFRRAKSVNTILMELKLDESLKTFDIEYDITGLVDTIYVRGMDTGKMKLISAKSRHDHKISRGNKAKQLLKNSERLYIDPTVRSQQDADYRVEYLLEDMSFRFGTLICDCVGLPELRPGNFVQISGLGEPAENCFYITEVNHVIDAEGIYRSKVTAKAASVL